MSGCVGCCWILLGEDRKVLIHTDHANSLKEHSFHCHLILILFKIIYVQTDLCFWTLYCMFFANKSKFGNTLS